MSPVQAYAGSRHAGGRAHPRCKTTARQEMVMNILERCLARMLNVIVKLLPRANEPEPSDRRVRPAPAQPRRKSAMQSPWRVYRLYAINSKMLLRGETGRIISIGTYAGVDPALPYHLAAGADRGPWHPLAPSLVVASTPPPPANTTRT